MRHDRIATSAATSFAASFAATVAGRDGGRLAAALTETVRLRALLPGGPVESHGRDAVVARFAGWFADFDTVELVDASGEPVADRLLVHYRFTLRQGPTRWTCTQTLIGKAAGHRLATLDLLCSGFRQIYETETGTTETATTETATTETWTAASGIDETRNGDA